MSCTNTNISFFNLYSDLFSIISKKVNQIRNNVVYVVARLVFVFCCALTTGLCNAFQYIFVNQKNNNGVLRSIFPDYVFSCTNYVANYLLTRWGVGSEDSGECLCCTCVSQFNSCFIRY